jgi:hypothetical protein
MSPCLTESADERKEEGQSIMVNRLISKLSGHVDFESWLSKNPGQLF